jgi:hypothetical protein
MKPKSKIGMRIGRLVPQEIVGTKTYTYGGKSHSGSIYSCLCDCGNTVELYYTALNGNTKSCGCLKEEFSAKKKLAPYEGAYNKFLNSCVKHSGLECNLTLDQFTKIVKKPCEYCGSEPSNSVHCRKNLMRNGVDRLDNNLGYIWDNVIPCCWICNRAKSALSIYDFTVWVDRLISKNQNNFPFNME